MPAAPISPNEKKRLAAVNKLRLMGTPAEERFDKITHLARQLFNVPMAVIDIVGEKLAWLKSVQGFDGIEGMRKDSYCHHTVMDDGLCLINNAHNDPRVCDSAFADTWVFYAGMPLHFDGERVGVICIGDIKPREFKPDQFTALADLAMLVERELEIAALSEAQLTLALSNEELQMKANIDILTHLWNRGAILGITEIELSKSSNQTMVALLMIDIDNYKHINDNYGHCAGDQVLRVIAERLRMATRPMDAVGRYGGDEFLVVLADVSLDKATKISQRICNEVSRTPVVFENTLINVTCSVGCATTHGVENIKTILTRADEALYRAKSAGRNGIVLIE